LITQHHCGAFVTISTLPCFAALSAKLNPAIPEPTTKKSTSLMENYSKN